MNIPFIQFLMPGGRQRMVYITREDGAEIALKAEFLLANDCRFEIEMLQTKDISMECLDRDGESLAGALCENGTAVTEAVNNLIRDAFKIRSPLPEIFRAKTP